MKETCTSTLFLQPTTNNSYIFYKHSYISYNTYPTHPSLPRKPAIKPPPLKKKHLQFFQSQTAPPNYPFITDHCRQNLLHLWKKEKKKERKTPPSFYLSKAKPRGSNQTEKSTIIQPLPFENPFEAVRTRFRAGWGNAIRGE